MSAQETEAPNVTVLETLDPPKEETPPEVAEPLETEAPAVEEEVQERDETTGQFKPKNATQARIDELTRQRHESAREAAYWRAQAEAQKPKSEPEAPKGKPSASEFESYEAFTEALAEWKLDEKLNQRDRQTQERARAQTWAERASAVKAEIPDFDSVMSTSTAPMSAAMAEAIKDSDIGPKVAYHLAQNPDVAARIAHLSATGAAREIGKLEAALSAHKAAPTEKRTTQAPQPATPIGSGRSTVGDPSKMSQADYLTWRNTQLKESR